MRLWSQLGGKVKKTTASPSPFPSDPTRPLSPFPPKILPAFRARASERQRPMSRTGLLPSPIRCFGSYDFPPLPRASPVGFRRFLPPACVQRAAQLGRQGGLEGKPTSRPAGQRGSGGEPRWDLPLLFEERERRGGGGVRGRQAGRQGRSATGRDGTFLEIRLQEGPRAAWTRRDTKFSPPSPSFQPPLSLFPALSSQLLLSLLSSCFVARTCFYPSARSAARPRPVHHRKSLVQTLPPR